MTGNCYGPTHAAEHEVNRLLGLNATGREQDWEIEFADPGAIDTMLAFLSHQQLSLETRTALCLLMLASFEEGFDAGDIDVNRMRRAAILLRQDAEVLERMRFYWLELGRTTHRELTMKILSG